MIAPSEDIGVIEESPQPLTPRQLDILQLIVKDMTAKEIGQALNISAKTVEFHKDHIRKNLNVNGVAGMLRYALKNGIVQL